MTYFPRDVDAKCWCLLKAHKVGVWRSAIEHALIEVHSPGYDEYETYPFAYLRACDGRSCFRSLIFIHSSSSFIRHGRLAKFVNFQHYEISLPKTEGYDTQPFVRKRAEPFQPKDGMRPQAKP